MFQIIITISGKNKSTVVTEKGRVLENMRLKKDVKTSILKILAEKQAPAGEYDIDFVVERDGKYFDHDEITIKVKADYSDYKVIAA